MVPIRNTPMWPALEGVAHTLAYDGLIIMDDGNSPDRRRPAVQALADTIPNAQRRTLAGQTHALAPAAIAPVLEQFLASAVSWSLRGWH